MNSRRNFLQKLTASVIAFNLPRFGSAFNSDLFNRGSQGPVLRVAIMGLGSYGTRVAEAMKTCTRAKLVGVISGTPSKITEEAHSANGP